MIGLHAGQPVNDTHQLLVSISKHLYVLKSGDVTHQKKAMEVNLKNYHRTGREHIIHYIIRDKATRMMYVELHSVNSPSLVMDFLCRAWKSKYNFYFEGMPRFLSVPETIYSEELGSTLRQLGITPTKPESGFRAGVRSVRLWEEALTWFALHYPGIRNFAELRHYTEYLADELNTDDQSRTALWESSASPKQFPPAELIKPYCGQRIPVDRRAFMHLTAKDLQDG